MADFTIKKRDTFPPLEAVLSDQTGPINLTGAKEVHFYMTAGGTLIKGVMTIVNAAKGEVKYEWAAEDLKVSGIYKAEIEITWTTGLKLQTVPNDRNLEIVVLDDLGP